MILSPTLDVTAVGEREIRMARSFRAPRQLVFDAFTKPELIRRWLLGPDGWTMEVCNVDLRVGGKYRYEWRKESGETMAMGGSYVEIAPPDRLVTTELFDEDWTGGETLSTLELREEDGWTTLINTVVYPTREGRDGALATGMAEGMEAGFVRLERLLAVGG